MDKVINNFRAKKLLNRKSQSWQFRWITSNINNRNFLLMKNVQKWTINLPTLGTIFWMEQQITWTILTIVYVDSFMFSNLNWKTWIFPHFSLSILALEQLLIKGKRRDFVEIISKVNQLVYRSFEICNEPNEMINEFWRKFNFISLLFICFHQLDSVNLSFTPIEQVARKMEIFVIIS